MRWHCWQRGGVSPSFEQKDDALSLGSTRFTGIVDQADQLITVQNPLLVWKILRLS
jgi:hypothetical protein